MRTCSICPKVHYAKNYCSRHYTTWKTYGDPNHELERRDGIAKHPLYVTYTNMVKRCTNPNTKDAAMYKERGITVCDRWLESIDNFLADMGDKPSSKHSLDRIDNSKGYSPDNCRWATPREQAHNTRKNNAHPNVYWAKHRQSWYIQFYIDGKRTGISGIKTLEEAIKLRDNYAV